jgi:hypothetical protein
MKYNVTVEVISHVTYQVEANSEDEANKLAQDFDGELVEESIRDTEVIHTIPSWEAA